MIDCAVCAKTIVFICSSCKLAFCENHNATHQKRNKRSHAFEKSKKSLISEFLSLKSNTLSSKSTLDIASKFYIPAIPLSPIKPYMPRNSLNLCKDSESLQKIKSIKLDAAKKILAQEHYLFIEAHSNDVTSVLITSDNKYLITASYDTSIRIWNLHSKMQEYVFQGHSEWVTSIALTIDNKFIISASDDKNIIIWNFQEKIQEAILQGHQKYVKSVAVTSDNKYIVSGSADKTVRIWNLQEH